MCGPDTGDSEKSIQVLTSSTVPSTENFHSNICLPDALSKPVLVGFSLSLQTHPILPETHPSLPETSAPLWPLVDGIGWTWILYFAHQSPKTRKVKFLCSFHTFAIPMVAMDQPKESPGRFFPRLFFCDLRCDIWGRRSHREVMRS